MTTDDRVDRVMPVVADRHRELHLVLRNLTRIEARPRRDDVVERRAAESPARRQPDAEILGMAVGDRSVIFAVALSTAQSLSV